MKVLLSTPPWKTTERWPPLGLLYIAESIERIRSDKVTVVDAFCLNMTSSELVKRAVQESPDVMGLSCSTHTFEAAMEVLRMVRERLPGTVIVLGGIHATFEADRILRSYPFVDYIIKGEAENAFPALLERIEEGDAPEDVPGISYLRGDGSVHSNPLTLIEDLDSLPFPERERLGDFTYGYQFQGINLTFRKFTTITSSRGCPFSCSYCSCAAFSERRWRSRSAANVVNELEMLYRQGYREAVFVDDNFTQNIPRVEEICRLITARGIRMKLYCEGRVGHAQLPFLRTMKEAGFNVIYFGAESSSPRVLDFYHKRQTPQGTAEAVTNAKKAGMLVITSFILGAPVETREEMRQTIQFARSMRPHGVQYNILDYLPGTPLWADLEAQGMVKEDDWKTNHRVYEYFPEASSQAELEAMVKEGYSTFVGAWENGSGILEILRALAMNATARGLVLGNVVNPVMYKALISELRRAW